MLSLILALALGSWGPGGCASVEAPVVPDTEVLRQRFAEQKRTAEFNAQRVWNRTRKARLPFSSAPLDAKEIAPDAEWRTRSDEPNRKYLFRSGKQVGGWDEAEQIWRDFKDDVWSEPKEPPWVQNFGISVKDLHPDGGYSFCGQKVDWKSVQSIFGDDRLQDDSKKPRLTVWGDGRERVLADLKTHPSLAPFANKFLLQSLPFGHSSTKVFGPASDYPFYLSVQLPADAKGRGKEIHAQKAYAGPEALAIALTEAVRKADPTYDPLKTPDLSKPKPLIDGDTNWLLWVAGAFLAYILLSGPRK